MKVTKEMVRQPMRETTFLKNGQMMEITVTMIVITIRRITRGGYFTNHPSSDSARNHRAFESVQVFIPLSRARMPGNTATG